MLSRVRFDRAHHSSTAWVKSLVGREGVVLRCETFADGERWLVDFGGYGRHLWLRPRYVTIIAAAPQPPE